MIRNENEHPIKLEPQIREGVSFLMVGTDYYWKDRYTGMIRRKLMQNDDTELSVLYGDEIKPGLLMDKLDSFSLFSAGKLIIIKGAEAIEKKSLEALAAYFEDPAEKQCLVIQAEKIDSRLGAWKKIKEACLYIPCDKPRWASEIKSWLQTRLREEGRSMSPGAVANFIARVELDYTTAESELQKLILISAERKSITEADTERSLGGARLGAQTDFCRALGKKDLAASISTAMKMLESEAEPLQVLFTIHRFFMSIWKIVSLRARHISPTEIISSHLNEHFQSNRKEYVEMAANWDGKAMERVFEAILDMDNQVKSAQEDPKLLLTVTISKICGS